MFPDQPTRIPDDTSVQQRLRLLNQISDEGMDSEAIRRAAARIAPVCAMASIADMAWMASGECQREYAKQILAFTQRLPYYPDPPGEWFQSARYTLAHGGDCEDLASLFVALCRFVGIQARTVWMDESGQYNHVTAQVLIDGKWLWAESILPGAGLGEEPHAALARLGARPDLVDHL